MSKSRSRSWDLPGQSCFPGGGEGASLSQCWELRGPQSLLLHFMVFFDPPPRLWGLLGIPMISGHRHDSNTLVWNDFYPRQSARQAQRSGLPVVYCQRSETSPQAGPSVDSRPSVLDHSIYCLGSTAPKGSRDVSGQHLCLGSHYHRYPGRTPTLFHRLCTMFQAVPPEWLHLIPLEAMRPLLHNAKGTSWLMSCGLPSIWWGCALLSRV